MNKTLLALTLSGLYASAASAATPSTDEMWKIIQQQQAEISRLKGDQQTTNAKVEATADAVENGPINNVAKWVNDTSFGGYGELHYNNLDDQNGNKDKTELDLHRFVLFFGHEFTNDVRFFSEFEVEHTVSGEGQNGEVEIEQAYIEWDFAENHQAKAGVLLVPVGIMNETHEPDTFYGVERNLVEKNIVPVTWYEGGGAINGQIAKGLSYDFAVHSGLFINGGNGDFKIRDGRQKASEAKANKLAYTGRIKYTGIQGLELAATAQYQTDVFQDDTFAGQSNIGATLLEAHAAYQNGPFGLRALYAMWDIDSGINSIAAGADKQEGFYIEPSYLLTEKLGVFARYGEWDNQAGSSAVDSEFQQTTVGINYWLTPGVVLKADYQDQSAPSAEKELDGFNLGVGYSF